MPIPRPPIGVLVLHDSRDDTDLLLKALLGTEIVVGRAHNLDGARAVLNRSQWIDVILMDMSLPESKHVDAVVLLHAEFPDIPIVVLAGVDDDTMRETVLAYGAHSVLMKDQHTNSSLLDTIRRVAGGD
jgi:DNA-binding NarL/FixJ family response regulator